MWSVLAEGLCCIMAQALSTDVRFCSCHLLRIQTKCLLLPCLSTPTGDPDHQTSQDLMCSFSLLHVSDGPGNMELCLVPALSPAPIHLRGFPVGQVPTLLLIGELLLLLLYLIIFFYLLFPLSISVIPCLLFLISNEGSKKLGNKMRNFLPNNFLPVNSFSPFSPPGQCGKWPGHKLIFSSK